MPATSNLVAAWQRAPYVFLCSLQTYIMYLIKYLAVTVYFSVMSNKLLPYHVNILSSLYYIAALSIYA